MAAGTPQAIAKIQHLRGSGAPLPAPLVEKLQELSTLRSRLAEATAAASIRSRAVTVAERKLAQARVTAAREGDGDTPSVAAAAQAVQDAERRQADDEAKAEGLAAACEEVEDEILEVLRDKAAGWLGHVAREHAAAERRGAAPRGGGGPSGTPGRFS